MTIPKRLSEAMNSLSKNAEEIKNDRRISNHA